MLMEAQNKIKINTTYIEKPKYYLSNRVFIVQRISKKFAIGCIIDFDKNTQAGFAIDKKLFRKRVEISPIQMR